MKWALSAGARAAVNIALPAIIQNVGSLREDRDMLLLSFAKQAIEADACVFYLGHGRDELLWKRLLAIAAAAGRSSSCFAVGVPGVEPISPMEVLTRGGILWRPTPWLPGAEGDLLAFLEDLSSACHANSAAPDRHIVIFLEGCVSRIGAVPAELVDICGSTSPVRATLVVSERDATLLPPAVIARSDYNIVTQVMGLANESACTALLGRDEAMQGPMPLLPRDVAAIRTNAGGARLAFARLTPTPVRMIEGLGPANAAPHMGCSQNPMES